MMVRLEVEAPNFFEISLCRFQFHDGAIGRLKIVLIKQLKIMFQFHDGAIGS